jgi:hypothetical protein
MVSIFDMHNLVQYEAAKVADELYELVILLQLATIIWHETYMKLECNLH